MSREAIFKALAAALLGLAVAACTGGDDTLRSNPDDSTDAVGGTGTDDSNSDGGSTDQGTGTLDTFRIGSLDPAGNFVEGVLAIPAATLSAGGSTTVRAVIVDGSGTPATDPVDVIFTSLCAASDEATLTSPVTATNGQATSTFRATGCTGDDVVTATASPGQAPIRATGTVTVAAPTVNAITFDSATPATIALAGTGGTGRSESSVVQFRVESESGDPVPGLTVRFELTNTVGGLAISAAEDESDLNGLVQTVVQAGSVATVVRVRAILDVAGGSQITTVSDQLTVSTGLPDQESMSIAASVLNPEALNFDNVEVEITASMADHFNNFVPDGTTVNFVTEAGRIEPSCETANGTCTVSWFSSGQRPEDGRTTIRATAIGEESFTDLNSNGRLDVSEPFVDLTEAFLDADEDLCYDTDAEEFLDFSPGGQTGDGVFLGSNTDSGDLDPIAACDAARNSGDGVYNGTLCAGDFADPVQAQANCSTDQKSLSVRASLQVVMAGSGAVFSDAIVASGGAGLRGPDLADARRNDPGFGTGGDCGSTITLTPADPTAAFNVYISDVNAQPMPAGTTVTAGVTVGEISGVTNFEWPSTSGNGGEVFAYTLRRGQNPQPGVGDLTITVTSPRGLVSRCTASVSITN